jgi:aspartate-semialdehyde dehydrogenase
MSYRIAVVGATGNIGRELLNVLAERQADIAEVAVLASSRSTGTRVDYGDSGDDLMVKNLAHFDFKGWDLALFAVPDELAAEVAPKAAAAGCLVVDASAAFRRDIDVPVIVPEVNPDAVTQATRRIIAMPCAPAAQAAAVLAPLADEADLARVVATLLIAVSEAGKPGMDELFEQTRGIFVGDTPSAKVFSQQIAFNLIPAVGDWREDGSTSLEAGFASDLRRLLGDGLKVSATAVRVPVFVGHGLALNVELAAPLTEFQARAQLREAAGVMVVDKREAGGAISPVEAVGEYATYVSRIRKDASVPHGLALWVTADNLRKSVALNMVQTAELALRKRGRVGH